VVGVVDDVVMSSQSLRRLILLSFLCFATFILVVKFNPTTHFNVSSSSSKQLWQSSNIPTSIANTTLGVRIPFVDTSLVQTAVNNLYSSKKSS
jgi:hypothetical protein